MKTLKGKWSEVLTHRDEIPEDSFVEVKVFPQLSDAQDPTIALLESWLAEAPTDPDGIREAEQDLADFKCNMNRPRKETGARLIYPETA